MLRLEVIEQTGRRAVAIDSSPFQIGRSSENQLQISDTQASRYHAELREEADGWHVRDCGSRFGTFLNDQKIQDAPVHAGDRLRLGQTLMQFVDEGFSGTISGSGTFDLRQMNALLASLRAMGSARVLDEVLAIVLDCALEVTGAERGFILLADTGKKEGKTLVLTLARARGGITLPSAQTSQRIPEAVFATGVDQIVTDLQDDEHAAAHLGTVALGIRHVLCTPLNMVSYGTSAAAGRIGVLYLDSRERGYLQHVDALRALAAQAAVVIENARLYREVVDRERAAEELRVAAGIQQALLPSPAFRCTLAELAAKSTPCQAVGGDFFDYAEQTDGGLAFAIGDVAGKGTSAALLTAVIQGLFTSEVEARDEPGTIIARINRGLCRRAIEARFVTAFYGQLQPGGLLRYCNAGHNPPFLLMANGVQRLETGGCILGIFDTAPFQSGDVSVSSGDVLVLFSDGVTEAMNGAGEELGDARLEACLQAVRALPPDEILAAVEREVAAFCHGAPALDDVTVMVVRIR
jgi:serine phosphatase RsbU (regulator of sigma subunit)/pSer/pThr/pTyr-binding forkhead associated (FHA) protein